MPRFIVGPQKSYRAGQLYGYGEPIEIGANETPSYTWMPDDDEEARAMVREVASNFLPPLRPGQRGRDEEYIRRTEENKARQLWAPYLEGVIFKGTTDFVSVENASLEQLEELLYRKKMVSDMKAKAVEEAAAKFEASFKEKEAAATVAAKAKVDEEAASAAATTKVRAADKDLKNK